jgi:hypothetical protein
LYFLKRFKDSRSVPKILLISIMTMQNRVDNQTQEMDNWPGFMENFTRLPLRKPKCWFMKDELEISKRLRPILAET